MKTATTAGPLAHLIGRLQTAEIVREPFPHYYLENVFPSDYYQTLREHLPPTTVYQNLFAVTDYKLDHFRHRDQRDLHTDWTSSLPPQLQTFWDSFDEWFLGPELAQAALESFASYLPGAWPEVSVESQLIRHRAGYFLGPHSDLYTKVMVLLIYLAPDDSAAHLGTSLYRPKDPGFSCPNSKHYPFEDFVRVVTTPYKANSMLAFLRSDISFHGVEPLSETDVASTDGRDLIQYVLHDKAKRTEQLRAKKATAKEGYE